MKDDRLDDFMQRNLPSVQVSWAREERIVDAVLARTNRAAPPALGIDLRGVVGRLAVPMASAAGIGALSSLLLSPEDGPSLDALISAVASIFAAF